MSSRFQEKSEAGRLEESELREEQWAVRPEK